MVKISPHDTERTQLRTNGEMTHCQPTLKDTGDQQGEEKSPNMCTFHMKGTKLIFDNTPIARM